MLSFLPAEYYRILYFAIVSVITIFVVNKYLQRRLSVRLSRRPYESMLYWLFTIALIVFIGLRPVSGAYFVDMATYNYQYLIRMGDTFTFDWNTDNIIFDNLFLFFSSSYIPVHYFFLFIALIYFACISFSCLKLFPNDRLASMLVYLGALSTFAYATNGIKAGAAASLFLVALAFDKHGRLFLTILFLALSLGFHHSMVLPITAFVVCKLVKNPRVYSVFWLVSLVLSAAHVTFIQHLFAGFVDDQGALYLLGGENNVRHDIFGGFRIDFILYSLAPILIGWYYLFKNIKISKEYIFLLNLYTLSNAIWLLCMYAEFTNRIAYLSWFMLPVLLIYPYLEERIGRNQFRTFHWVVLGHLAFTLFMNFIYW